MYVNEWVVYVPMCAHVSVCTCVDQKKNCMSCSLSLHIISLRLFRELPESQQAKVIIYLWPHSVYVIDILSHAQIYKLWLGILTHFNYISRVPTQWAISQSMSITFV